MKGLASQYRFLRLTPRGFSVIAKPAGGMIGLGGFRVLIVLLLLAVSLIMVPLSGAETLHDRSLRKLQDRLAKTNPQDFTFIVLGDSRDGDETFRKLLTMAASFHPLFILHTGDLTRTGAKAEYDRFFGIVNDTVPDIPLFAVIGNHDIDREGITQGTQKKAYTDRIGPLNYVLDIPPADLRLVALDNSEYNLTASQLTYLREKLEEKGALRIVAMHVPPEVGRWKGGV
jgi:predicted phosphodiesterase